MTQQNMLVTTTGFVPMTIKQTERLCNRGVISAIHQEEEITYYAELETRGLYRVLAMRDHIHRTLDVQATI